MKYCPTCNVQAEGNHCSRCGAVLVPYVPVSKRSTGVASVLTGLCLTVSLICVGLGFALPETVLQEMGFFVLAAVFGIFARIAQADEHHAEMMNKP